jgi:hypothetical protein
MTRKNIVLIVVKRRWGSASCGGFWTRRATVLMQFNSIRAAICRPSACDTAGYDEEIDDHNRCECEGRH